MAHPDLGEGTRLAASTGAWIVFEDEAGATLRPPKARTWAARGHTPVVAVSGKGGRVSMAALVCYRPGCRGPAVLPDPGASPPPRGAAQLLRRRLRCADRRRARPAHRPHHPDLGQPQRAPQCGDGRVL